MDHIRDLLPAIPENLNPATNAEWVGDEVTSKSLAKSFLQNPSFPTTGLSLYVATGSEMVNGLDLDYALRQVSRAYRVDAYDEESPEFSLIGLLQTQAVADGMTGQEFRARIDRLVKTQKFPTWTPADFFEQNTPKLHPYSWFVERIAENRANKDAIAGYRVAGYNKPLFGWKCEVGDLLPLFVAPDREPDDAERAWNQANAEARGMTEETRAQLNLVKENLGLREKLAKVESDLAAMRTDLAAAMRERDEWRSDALALQGYNVNEEEGVL